VSALEAKLKAEGEYEVYRKRQDAEFVSDFDRIVDETKRLEGIDRPKGLVSRGTTKAPSGVKPEKPSAKGRKGR